MSTDIGRFFSGNGVDIGGLAGWLDGLPAAERAAQALSLGARQQARLFEAAAGHRAIGLETLVPGSAGLNQPVHFAGRNSLPAFSRFEKRFLRSDTGPQLWGYNEGAARRFVGPGYFVARERGGEVLVDYRVIPAQAPHAAWPEPRPNSAGLSRLVFHELVDTLRGVSRHLHVGRGYRHGQALPAWFLLLDTGS